MKVWDLAHPDVYLWSFEVPEESHLQVVPYFNADGSLARNDLEVIVGGNEYSTFFFRSLSSDDFGFAAIVACYFDVAAEPFDVGSLRSNCG